MIQCKDCKTKNVNDAQFCRKCGKKITKEEREKVKEPKLVKSLKFFEKFKGIITLERITSDWRFKLISILIILGIGVFNIINNGLNMKIKESENYKLQYLKTTGEYYLISPTEKTSLDLYIPSRAKETNIMLYNDNNELLEETKVEEGKEIVLDKNEIGNYYIIESNYSKNNMDIIKLFVCQEQLPEVKENEN